MVTRPAGSTQPRVPLTKERVLQAAIDLADRDGIEALSMRRLAHELGVEAMSLYNHVRNKEDLLDGVADAVVGAIEVSTADANWKSAMRERVIRARTVMLRHPWAPDVIKARVSPGPATLAYMEAALAILREASFSVDLAHHSMHVLGSRILGFNQDLFDDSSEQGPSPESAALLVRQMAEAFPYIAELSVAISHDGGLGGCDDDVEFAFGLDLILDGLERLRRSA
jgi:AcrR family transcriptional regulator